MISNAYSDIGNSFQKAGELDSALFFYNKAKDVEQISPKKVAYTRSLINISETYKLQGQYIKSLEIAQQALAFSKVNNFKGFHPTIYILMGEIFLDIEDYPKAIANFKKAIVSAQETKNIKKLALSYEFLAKAKLKNNQFDLAENSLLESIKLGKETNIKLIEGRALWKLAELYSYQNLNQKALSTILESEELLSSNYDKIELINCLRIKGVIYNNIRKFSKAEDACLKAQSLNVTTGQIVVEKDICYCLFQAYEGLRNATLALKYFKIYEGLKDSIINYTITRKLTQIEYQNIYDNKVLADSIATINKLAKQELKFEQEATKQRTILIISIAVAIIFLLLIVFLIVIYSINKRKQTALKQKNELINEQKSKIEHSLGEKEILLKEIHHRVKNNLQIILGLLHLQAKGVEDKKVGAALNEGQTRIKSMALIHQKLYQTDDLAEVNLYEYVTDLGNYLLGMYPLGNKVQLEVDIDNIKLDIDTAIPLGLIINEAMTNALKYAFTDKTDPKIYLQIITLQEPGHYQFMFKDNGKGLPENFNIRKTKSLGFKLIRRLSQQLFGQLKLENDKGLSICISFLDTIIRNKTA